MTSQMANQETDNIAEDVVNSVLESDQESNVGSKSSSRRSSVVHTFRGDGLSFIQAMDVFRKSPLKEKPSENVVQKWQIWYWKRSQKQKSAKWEDYLQKKSSFTTKNEFWNVNHELNGVGIELLSDHFDCCVFKDGIKPMWEDTDNKDGGRWIIQINREKCWKHVVNVEEIWLKVVLFITGNGDVFPDNLEDICGAVLMVRHEAIKVAVWTKDANNTLANLNLCRVLKKCTGFEGKMWYERHSPDDKYDSKTRIRFKLPKKKTFL